MVINQLSVRSGSTTISIYALVDGLAHPNTSAASAPFSSQPTHQAIHLDKRNPHKPTEPQEYVVDRLAGHYWLTNNRFVHLRYQGYIGYGSQVAPRFPAGQHSHTTPNHTTPRQHKTPNLPSTTHDDSVVPRVRLHPKLVHQIHPARSQNPNERTNERTARIHEKSTHTGQG